MHPDDSVGKLVPALIGQRCAVEELRCAELEEAAEKDVGRQTLRVYVTGGRVNQVGLFVRGRLSD